MLGAGLGLVLPSILSHCRADYSTHEQVEKAPSEDHPCNLTRQTIKIAFPALRNQLFVNILGYR